MRLAIKNILPTTAEAFGPFCAYHFARGLTLTIGLEHASLKGGPELEKIYVLPQKSEPASPNFPPNYWPLIDQIEQEIGVRLIATASDSLPKEHSHETPQLRTTFRIGNYCINADFLAEALLAKFQTLESHCRRLTLYQIDHDSLSKAAEIVAITKDHIRDGRLGPNELEKRVQEMKSLGLPMEEAFFLSNAKSLADGARGTILRACYHFANMSERLYEINRQGIGIYHPGKDTEAPCEILHTAIMTDHVANEFASAITSCYSSLDLLYEWFVYLTREPFGKPHFPKNLHFPNQRQAKVFASGGKMHPSDLGSQDAPYAIPNLPENTFLGLRNLRNDLVHNMAPNEVRSRVCIGIGYPPVNNELLQYCQYITRDTDNSGNPIDHPWIRNFYKSQEDAQHSLHDWLTKAWQSIFDTTEWLTNRTSKM